MSELESLFENIMALNRWSGEESRSGPGSTLTYTCNLRSQLGVFVDDNDQRGRVGSWLPDALALFGE